MPTTKHIQHLTDLDYDLAQLGDPLTDEALDALSSIIDARDTLAEMTHIINVMQNRLEAGAPAYATREEYAFDLDQLADRLHIAISGVLG